MTVMMPPMSPIHGAGGDCLYYYASAPTSPTTRMTNFSYDWDERPPVSGAGDEASFDFAAGFGGDSAAWSTLQAAADELFEGGRIRPLNPYDYSSASVEMTRGRPTSNIQQLSGSPSKARRRAARSMSPMRVPAEEYAATAPSSPPSPKASIIRGCGGGSSRKWSLKDLFLFRSASEGRASGAGSKDPLLKYTLLSPSPSSLSSSAKLRSGGDSRIGSMAKGRTAPEEMRRRTPLPFHQNSLFGYLRSNAAIHSISKRLGRNRRSS